MRCCCFIPGVSPLPQADNPEAQGPNTTTRTRKVGNNRLLASFWRLLAIGLQTFGGVQKETPQAPLLPQSCAMKFVSCTRTDLRLHNSCAYSSPLPLWFRNRGTQTSGCESCRKQGASYRTQNSRALIKRTPTKGIPSLQTQPCGEEWSSSL